MKEQWAYRVSMEQEGDVYEGRVFGIGEKGKRREEG